MRARRHFLPLPSYLMLVALFLALGSLLLLQVEASILAIDYGTEFMKVSLIKPGVPFDVLLNRDSKRKIQSTVAWKGDDRLFGQDAFNLASRFPQDSFSHLKSLLGVQFDSEAVEIYKDISAAELVRTQRDTVGIRRFSRGEDSEVEWSVEELLAMQFAYVKELAESVSSSGGADEAQTEAVRDVVLAVPPYFTQFERDALVDALEIAGLRLLALVNDGTAVALNYAMTRSFPAESKEWHVVYDAGAGGVRAAVVGFSTVPVDDAAKGKGAKSAKAKEGAVGKESTHITVAGVGFDRSAGGLELDRRLRDMLVADFDAKYAKQTQERSVRSDRRGLAKLWKEAGRVKAVLSANSEASVAVESLAFDVDYRSKVTRADFEERCVDLKEKFARVIEDAVGMAGLKLDDITSVILTGGHSRTPMVQAAIKALVGQDKIAVSVNADESAVLGAALYGASVSRQFRTKDIKVVDLIPYAIQVSYQSEGKNPVSEGDGEQEVLSAKPGKTINTLVFPPGSKVGSKKTLTFKRKDDFVVKMGYRDQSSPGAPTELLEATLSGIKEAIGNLTENGALDPVVKATVVLSESGFAGIKEAVAYGEIKKEESVVGKLKGMFGGGSSKEEGTEENATDVGDTRSSTSSDTATPSSSADKKQSNNSETSPPTKQQKLEDTIALTLSVKPLSIPALTPNELSRSRTRLAAVDAAEQAKRRRADAHNNLEAYLYRLRDLLENNADENPFVRCSKEDERTTIREKMEATLHWMHEEADEASLVELLDKRDAIERLERPIVFRYKEIEAFPTTLNQSQYMNFMSRVFLAEARENLTAAAAAAASSSSDDSSTEPPPLAKWTLEELDAFERSLREHEAWLDEWVEKQKKVKPNEDPVILTTEMKARARTLENSLSKLMRRRAPPKPKKTSSSSSSSSSTSTTSDSGSGSGGEQATTSAETASRSTESAQAPHDEL